MSFLRVVQFADETGTCRAGVVADDAATIQYPADAQSVYDLALQAAERNLPLSQVVSEAGFDRSIPYAELVRDHRLLSPIHHPDPAHCYLTGTGLTHRQVAVSRDAMRQAASPTVETDSIRMYRLGEQGGRPGEGKIGSAPEWFYKGNGHALVAPGADIEMPAFARDGGEEVEIAGIYVIDSARKPHRIGYALANEFADHDIERENYLYLAHSKLRGASIGPEILVGELPGDIRGTARIRRNGAVLWEREFATGDANMCHSIANLEHHHFKYAQFREPGDVHIHFFGAAAVSFGDGIKTAAGDVFEISAPPFTQPLRNRLTVAPDEGLIKVQAL